MEELKWNNVDPYRDPLGTSVDADKIKDVMPDERQPSPQSLVRLSEMRRMFENAVDYRKKWTEAANEDFQFYYGDQWPQSARTILNDGGRPNLTLNKIKSVCNAVIGYQTQNRYEPDFMPRTADDLELAEIRRGVTKYVLDQTQYGTTETKLFSDAIIGGIGDSYVGWEYNEFYPNGRIVIKKLSSFDVYWDPEARETDFSDAEYVCHASWQSKGKVARMFPEHEDAIYGFNMDSDYAEYIPGHLGGMNSVDPVWYIQERQKVRLVTIWYKVYKTINYVYGPDGTIMAVDPENVNVPKDQIVRQEGFTEIRCATMIQSLILEDVPSPYDHGMLPIIPLVAYYTGEGDTPSGIVRDIKDAQLEVNKRRSQILHILNSSAFNGLIAESGTMTQNQKDNYSKFGSKPGTIVEVVAGGLDRIKFMTPPPLPESLARLETAFSDDIENISGVNKEMIGTDVPSSSSGRAIELRQRMAVTQIAMLFDGLRVFKYKLMQLLWGRGDRPGLIQQFYTDELVVRITQDSEEPDFRTVNQQMPLGVDDNGNVIYRTINDLTVGEFDVVITESPTTPTKRYADFLALMEMMKTPLGPVLAERVPDVFLELSDIPNRNRIAQRIQEATAQEQQAMQMQQGQQQSLTPGQGSQSNPPSPVDAAAVQQAMLAAG